MEAPQAELRRGFGITLQLMANVYIILIPSDTFVADMDFKDQNKRMNRARKMVKNLKGKPYEEQLKSLGLFSLEETERRPHCSYNFFMREGGGTGTDLFSVVTNDRTRGNGLKLHQGRFRLDIRK
ncbi:hypothetical protein DUI87_18388 [Hirundo rustica rustica]|uniref:Uncharacterized protein n=1 Tax=Hirundo rustica rustica TaxID=333673 RepID=A0A3M0K1S0_HIRRU|nr:hypothetical protein DUI87_18388 [Hirundo rustica rustica]